MFVDILCKANPFNSILCRNRAMAAEDDLMNEDLYALVGDGDLSSSSSVAQIKKAYKTKAKLWHPDKNPDDKEGAAKRFQRLKKGYDLLCDEKKRQQYDAKLRAKAERKRRIEEDDDLTRKMKERLEAREAAVNETRTTKRQKTDEQRTKQESMDFVCYFTCECADDVLFCRSRI